MVQYEKEASSPCWFEDERETQRNEGSLYKLEKVRKRSYLETSKKKIALPTP